jgi:chloramphenicol-sensitive protein RarD
MQNGERETKGVLLVLASYVIWGLFPLYWRLLDGVPAPEIALHRIVWCAFCAGAIAVCRRRGTELYRSLTDLRLIGTLTVSGLLVTADWTIYIYGVAVHRLVETSLGLFVTPLFSILLGVLFLGERISPLRLAAITLGVVALAAEIFAYGRVPWIALGIAFSFGCYGYVRKKAPVDPLDGLLIETGLLAPFAAAALLFLAVHGSGSFRLALPGRDIFLILSGVVTLVPLALFVTGARRIRLTTVGLVQYFSPGLTLLLATFGFDERFTRTDVTAFSCIWAALLLTMLEGRLTRART